MPQTLLLSAGCVALVFLRTYERLRARPLRDAADAGWYVRTAAITRA
jgi:hypothetical protein